LQPKPIIIALEVLKSKEVPSQAPARLCRF
jgi:hypothetical protein